MDMEVEVSEDDHFMTVNCPYPDFEITMHAYLCKVKSQEFVRKEHIDHKWLRKEELNTLDWAPADQPIVAKLMEKCDGCTGTIRWN